MDLDTTRMKNFSTTSLITRTTNDITQIQMIISMGLMMLIKAPILAITAIIKIVNKSLELSLLTAAAVVIIVGTILIIMYLVLPRFKLVQKLTDDVNRIARETLTGNKVVRAFNAEDYEQEKFDELDKAKCVTRELNVNNRREILVKLTDQGIIELKSAEKIRVKNLTEKYAHLSDQELETIYHHLHEISSIVNK